MTRPDGISQDQRSRLRPGPQTILAGAGGVLMTLGLPPQPLTGLLVPLGLACVFAAVLRAERPARTAWFFALAHQATLLYWLFFLDPAKSIPTRALVPVQAVAAILYVSLFYLAWGAAVGLVRRLGGPRRALVAAPALWTGMEALRALGELGFPWCLTGSCVVGSPLLPLAAAAGEMGVGAVVAGVAAVLAAARLPRGGRAPALGTVAAATVVLAAYVVLGSFFGDAASPAPAVQVAAVQGDVALADKWVAARIDSTKIPHEELTRRAAAEGAELIVWAETAVPAYLRYDVGLLNWVRRIVRETGVHLYTGFPDADQGPDGKMRQYNSSGLMAPDGIIRARYAKHHLLPIGETMPFQSVLPFLGKLDVGQAEWQPGPPPQPMLVVAEPGRELPFSGLICFESIFGRLARGAVREGSRCLVVITNDGWFGETAGPRQHAALARLRAAECGVPLVRCANNGISLICDEQGRVLDSLGLGRRGTVRAAVAPGAGDTLYVRFGFLPVAALLGLQLLCALAAPWLRARPGEGAA
jgi:apolipoprotein N-acyltransferase